MNKQLIKDNTILIYIAGMLLISYDTFDQGGRFQ